MKPKRIYIIPTWFSVIAGTILLFVTVSSGVSNQFTPVLFAATGLIAGIFGLIQTNNNLRGLSIVGQSSEPTASGEKIAWTIQVHNSSAETRRMIEVSFGKRQLGGKRTFEVIPEIPGNSTVAVTLVIPPKTRGIYESPDVRLGSRFPFGVAFAWNVTHSMSEIIVFPRPNGTKDWPVLSKDVNDLKDHKVGEGDFWGHRTYQQGDTLKHVDWKVFARSHDMHIKQFAHGEFVTHVFKYEDIALNDHEQRLEQLSLWVNRAYELGHSFGLELEREKLAVALGKVNYHKALRLLAKVHV